MRGTRQRNCGLYTLGSVFDAGGMRVVMTQARRISTDEAMTVKKIKVVSAEEAGYLLKRARFPFLSITKPRIGLIMPEMM